MSGYSKRETSRGFSIKKSLMMVVVGLLAFAGVVNAYTLDKVGDWTLTGSSSGDATASVATWDSNVYKDQTLTAANISVIFSTITYTSDTLLGPTESSSPSARVTLAVVDGLGNIEYYTLTSARMQGGVATVNGDGKFVYEFGGTMVGTLPVYDYEVGFLQSAGAGSRSYSVSFDLYDSSRTLVTSGYTVDGAGSVNVSYVYSGTPVIVPEPVTGALALAGIGMLFGRRRRRVA